MVVMPTSVLTRRTKANPPVLPMPQPKWTDICRSLGLAARHREVVELILQNKSAKQIARELGLKIPTVRTYLQRIYIRSGVVDRMGLVLKLFAASHNLDVVAENDIAPDAI
jgi:DNA-binding CsgD family transcriptional regulator